MTHYPDYSNYLKIPGMLAWIEQEWKEKPNTHEQHAAIINDVARKYKLNTLLEIGCGTGEVAMRLEPFLYKGIDGNSECIAIANNKNPELLFAVADIRNYKGTLEDLVFSFGFLKHFGLHEWADIFKKLCSLGRYFVFDMPIAQETKDDGTEYHHIWMKIEEVKGHIEANGFKLLDIKTDNTVEPVFICKKRKP